MSSRAAGFKISLAAVEHGDQVSDFELFDQTGKPWRLSTALADGPVILFFYPAAMTAALQGGMPLP